jgi:hypothetical protein
VEQGQAPPEAILSGICEMFHCTPDVAREIKYSDVRAITDYRNAVEAKRLHGNIQEMAKYPELVQLWRELTAALRED